MKVVWMFLLSVAWVFGVGLVLWLIFLIVTRSKRRGLEDAADEEYQELFAQDEIKHSGVSFLGGRRRMTEVEKKDWRRLQTDSGKELARIEKIGKWIILVGVVLALVALVIYWRVN